jgi:zinc transport system ATP-binding protein
MLQACEHCCSMIDHLSVELNGQKILEDVNLHVNCGEVIAIIGPNGAGKTTLLKTILGEVPYKGKMTFRVAGRKGKPRLGYVPQKTFFEVDAPLSVLDFVTASVSKQPIAFGLRLRHRRKMAHLLKEFSVDHLLDKKIGELSGGELQRVLLAVSMTPPPQFLLLDEPGAGVDVKGLELFYQLVRGLKDKHDISVIIVTHDLAGISKYVDRMVLLNKRILAQGEPKEVLSDRAAIAAFGPTLWNISEIPHVHQH